MKAASREAATERPVKGEVVARGGSETPRTALGPLPCIGCGQQVVWLATNDGWRLMQGGVAHKCSLR